VLDKKNKNMNANEDGMVWIESQKVFVKNNKGTGIPPTIAPGKGITLKVDGIIYNHITIVDSNCNIEIITNNETIEPSFEVSFSEEKLYAYLEFKPGINKSMKIKNHDPQNSLVINLDEIRVPFNNTTRDKVIEVISKSGVVVGIIEKAIDEVIKSTIEQKFLIAQGVESVNSSDAYIEYFFDVGNYKKKNLEDPDDNINYRDMWEINYIEQNSIIAIKHNGIEGKKGIDVKGEDIEPIKPKDIRIISGDGVVIDDTGLLVKTTTSGIPTMVYKGNDIQFNVLRIFKIKHDIDLSIGNIQYPYDISIDGNVNESMKVSSLDNVSIKGNVYFATVTALNDISIKGNTISSKISSGPGSLSGTFLGGDLQDILDGLNIMIMLIEQLKKNAAFMDSDIKREGIGVLVKQILNLKLKDLPQKIFNLFLDAKKDKFGVFNTIAFEIYECLKVFLSDCTVIKSEDEVYKIKEILVENVKRCSPQAIRSSITINSSHNSELCSDGSIRVIGKGCYNTKIFSKKEVIVNGSFVGGEIISERYIKLSKVGTHGGSKSYIQTNANGSIIAEVILEGTVIKIGEKIYEFKKTERSINARLVNDEIVLR